MSASNSSESALNSYYLLSDIDDSTSKTYTNINFSCNASLISNAIPYSNDPASGDSLPLPPQQSLQPQPLHSTAISSLLKRLYLFSELETSLNVTIDVTLASGVNSSTDGDDLILIEPASANDKANNDLPPKKRSIANCWKCCNQLCLSNFTVTEMDNMLHYFNSKSIAEQN